MNPGNTGGVALIAMPFGLANMPSLALSLLKAGLAKRGISADIMYLSLRFANLVGYRFYQQIAQGDGEFLGEWIFTPAFRQKPLSDSDISSFWQDVFPRGNASLDQDAINLGRRVHTYQDLALDFVDDCLDSVDWRQYRVVGFTSMFQQNLSSLALARRIKERSPNSLIVFGGPNCEENMGAALLRNFPFIDAVFSGEADDTFPDFVEAAFSGTALFQSKGVITRGPNGDPLIPEAWVSPVLDMDGLPYPDFDDFFDQVNQIDHRFIPHIGFETARGCWWGARNHCTFCGLNGSTMAFRAKTAQRALDEVKYIQEKYALPRGITLMRCADQILDLSFFDSYIPGLAKLDPSISFYYETKTNLNDDQVRLLAKARITLLQPGIESFSTAILSLMKKGCTTLQNIQVIKRCTENGIQPLYHILYGFPGEDPEDYKLLNQLLPALMHLPPPAHTYAIRLVRFSPYFSEPEQFGISNVRPHRAYRQIYALPDDQLYDLAYRFEFDFPAGPHPDDYFKPTQQLVKTWRQPSSTSVLCGFIESDRILVWDDRSISRNTWVALTGPFREVLAYCDSIRHQRQIERQFAGPGGPYSPSLLQDVLRELVSRHFLIHDNQRYLSVVILNGENSAPPIPAAEVVTLQLCSAL